MTKLWNSKTDIIASTIAPSPIPGTYWADLSTDARGGVIKYFNGSEWAVVNDGSSNSDDDSTEAISELSATVTELSSTVSTLQTTVSANADDISTLTTSVSANADNISSLETTVTANTNSISTLSASVSTNTDNISSLETAVSTNADNIGALQTAVTTNTENISTLTTSVNTNTDAISTLTTAVNTNTENISSLESTVSTNTSSIASLSSELSSAIETLTAKDEELEASINSILAERLQAYGVTWEEGSTSATLTRWGNNEFHTTLPIQNAMRGCTLADDGTVNHYFNDDWTANEDGTEIVLNGDDGMVMVEIPEFYYTYRVENGMCIMAISQYALDGYTKMEKQYVSAYEACIDRSESTYKLASVVNTSTSFRGGNNDSSLDEKESTQLGMPSTYVAQDNFRTYARNRDTSSYSWNMYDYIAHNTLCMLYVIEYASFNSQLDYTSTLTNGGYHQGGLGNGVTTLTTTLWQAFNNRSPIVPCGTTDSLGNSTGVITYTLPASYDEDNTVTVDVPRYRGIENPFGHIYKKLDGILIDATTADDDGVASYWLAPSQSEYASAIDKDTWTHLCDSVSSAGYITDCFENTCIPLTTGASSTTGRCDCAGAVTSGGECLCVVGGMASDTVNAGLFCEYRAYVNTNAGYYCGTRLVYRYDSTVIDTGGSEDDDPSSPSTM